MDSWKFFKDSFFPSEMGNFWLFQQAKCIKELQFIRTGIRTLKTQIGEKNKDIEARQNVTGSY